MALTTTAKVKAWASPNLDSAKDTVLDICVDAATAVYQDLVGRVIESAAYTRYFDGDRADGRYREVISLPIDLRPVTAVSSVTEDGVALTVAEGYSTTADVLLLYKGRERQARLLRRTPQDNEVAGDAKIVSWAPGVQNIAVTFTAGYATVRADDELVANELAWLLFKGGTNTALAAKSSPGRARTLERQLSAIARDIIAMRRRL